jgi:hypothetical protein
MENEWTYVDEGVWVSIPRSRSFAPVHKMFLGTPDKKASDSELAKASIGIGLGIAGSVIAFIIRRKHDVASKITQEVSSEFLDSGLRILLQWTTDSFEMKQ